MSSSDGQVNNKTEARAGRAVALKNLGGKSPRLAGLLTSLQSVRAGDFSVRMDSHLPGIDGKIADAFNGIVGANQQMAEQLERVGRVVGREGKTRQRVKFSLTG